MRQFSFRLRLSAMAWIAIGSTLGLSSGCQQWSIRKNMGAFFGGESKDDWEPPVNSSRDEAESEAQAVNDMNRPWWSKRKGSGVQRVVLPRDRAAAASKYASESTNGLPKLPAAQLTEQSRSVPAARTAGTASSSLQNKSMPDNSETKPKGEMVAFGANPAGWPGDVTAPARDGTNNANTQARMIDTGVQDADLEASLQSLPPQFREVVQRTLQAVKEGKPIDRIESTAAAEPAPPPPTNASVPAPTAAATVAATSPPSKPVSVRLSEGSVNSFAAPDPAMSVPTTESAVNNPVNKVIASNTNSNAPIPIPGSPSVNKPTLPPSNAINPSNTVNPAVANSAPGNSSFISPAAGMLGPSNSSGSSTASHDSQPSNVALAVADAKSAGQVTTTSAMTPANLSSTSEASIKSSTWHGVISEAIEKLETDLESKPTADESLRRSQEITLRMLYVAQRRLDDALRPIERLEAHEQEYVRHQMQALYEASNPDANPAKARHWSSVMMSQREATAHLAAVSNLEVRSVAFCTQVDGYGTFQKFAKNQFASDQDVLLYCEIDNVAAEKVKLGYETQLQGSYEIRDNQGRLVADQDLPMEPEICSNHRRDYFIVYRIYMPSQLAPGNYELRLTIHDKKGGKYGHSSAAFEIRK